jgi:glycosyltransferase involved in cell wall biosynthesis
VDPEKIHILYPPLDVSAYNPELKSRQPELKRKFGMDPAKVTFLFVSVSHKRKGLELLIRIFRDLDDKKFELFIAGDDAGLRSSPNIRSLGYQTSLNEVYSAADFTIHPALFEPFGQIISESLQCGTPVVVSKNTGAKEILTANTGCVVNSLVPEDWIRVIENLDVATFRIPPDFAQSFRLTTEQHCMDILSLWDHYKAKNLLPE